MGLDLLVGGHRDRHEALRRRELRRCDEERVLPMPGSPSSVSAVSRPALAAASSCLIAPSSTFLRQRIP